MLWFPPPLKQTKMYKSIYSQYYWPRYTSESEYHLATNKSHGTGSVLDWGTLRYQYQHFEQYLRHFLILVPVSEKNSNADETQRRSRKWTEGLLAQSERSTAHHPPYLHHLGLQIITVGL